MKKWISASALAAALAVTAHAQDNTVKSRTQIKTDDAKAITATGCLVQGIVPGSFALRGGITASGDELTTKSRTKTDVDKDGSRVQSDTRTSADGDHSRVGAGSIIIYELSPRAGVNLAANVVLLPGYLFGCHSLRHIAGGCAGAPTNVQPAVSVRRPVRNRRVEASRSSRPCRFCRR